MQLVKQDAVRKRIATYIQAAPLLHPGTLQEVFTERVVELAEKMKATFVRIAGAEYLQDIGRESSSTDAMYFTIPNGQAQQLALLVDDVGIINIAFRANANGRPDWIRPDVPIRIVSDPIKCHRISPDLPGHNIGFPRPILPCAFGNWAPLPAASVDESVLSLSGYIKASYIEFHTLNKVYLWYNPSQILLGVFAEAGKGRVAVPLELNTRATVKLIRYWDGRPSLQVVLLLSLWC
ncbi:hypothetical protein BU23DRAFT_625798 [Bimuria novae-zelandiae CBS 107.79]|uniref:Uncharacterized protein n=1 Tax=Bimuria novae-zelandiae CBS 107.79 TaxID=1447943 RepID=A0A6A5VX94_9PLEO|nr:hypothetical protein BU23DRAFT_625798 [Bimuria novae-zelandiae CBS 107.79]